MRPPVRPPDIDRVTSLLREAAGEIVLPRFRKLRSDEIETKPGRDGEGDDVVTAVDHGVEGFLGRTLQDLAPSVPLVGEESAHRDPGILSRLEDPDPVWLLDPLDGTRNFVHGEEGFGIMLAWIQGGRALASWILLPVLDVAYAGEAGEGAFRDGTRLRTPAEPLEDPPAGTLSLRYMPADVGAVVDRRAKERLQPVAGSGASAVEYTDVLEGRRDFAVYHRLFPWDHAPGALLLDEAGGCVEHLDGSPYTLRSQDRITVVAGGPVVSAAVRTGLGEDIPGEPQPPGR